MPTARSLIAALTLALTAISCSDKGPTAPTDQSNALGAPVRTGPIFRQITATLSNGAAFAGTITVNQITRDPAGNLFAAGTLVGTATDPVTGTVTQVNQTFANVPLLLQPTAASCPILHLDLGPIHLNLLGLNVDLSRVILDITAQPGPGNLLGNLLCAVAHLLDRSPINLTALDRLLARINTILGG